MRDATLLRTEPLDPDTIDVSNRRRPFSELSVLALMQSIEETGIVKDEILVREVRHQGKKLRLIAGLHRIEACRRLGITVPTKVYDCTDDWADLMELDDNLAHAELDTLELAVFLARRKVIYEKMHPQTAAGVAGAAARWNASDEMSLASETAADTMSVASANQTDIVSFCQSVAEKRAMSKRQIYRLVAAGQHLDDGAVEQLRTAPRKVTLADLQVIAKCGNAETRATICADLNAGTHSSAKDALAATKAPPVQRDPIDVAHIKLREAWTRAPKKARRRFVSDFHEELTTLLADFTPEEDTAEGEVIPFATSRGGVK